MPQSGPPLLLINPWIYDFAAYDFFARPLGLLYLAGLAAGQGYAVHFLDCLGAPHARTGPFGTGRYPKEIIPPPPALGGNHPALRALRHQRGGFPGAPGPGPHPRRHPGDLPHDLLVPRGGRGHPPGPGALPRGPRHPGRDLRHPVPGARPKTQRRRPGGRRAGRSGHCPLSWRRSPVVRRRGRSLRTAKIWTPCPIRPWTSWTIPLIFPSSPPGAAPWIAPTAPPGSSSRFTGGGSPWRWRPS